MMINRDICELIPHAGSMCLLRSIKSWDDTHITCLSNSHRDTNNPLRNELGLPMVALLEYGAQAMAVHGGLLAEKDYATMQQGFLAALRNIKLASGWLSDIEDELEISVERNFADAGNMIYTMSISAAGIELASGRATVVAQFSEEEK